MEQQSLILVVDDQPRGRLALSSLLEPEGYRLIFAAGGHEALRHMAVQAPDLVLLDVMMPGMDGFEVCRRIRADPALALIPVVMITALDDPAALLEGIEAGADDFITKPFQRVELRARVRTITRLNRFRLMVNEQQRADNAQAQLLWALERAHDGYLLIDPAERLTYSNAQARRYLGLADAPHQPPHQPFRELVARQFRAEPSAAWAAWPEATSAQRYLVRPAGASASLWLQVELLDQAQPAQQNRVIRLQDVTALMTAQRQTWTFHSFLSHKLRTPLTSVIVGAGILHRHLAAFPTDLAMIVETTYGGAQRLKETIDAVFRYLEAPGDVDKGTGADCTTIPALVDRIAAELGIADLRITATIDQAVHLTIDTTMLELILTELFVNARKFHPQQHPALCVELHCTTESARLSILDDGLTLSPDDLLRIAQPYQQIDPDFTGQIPGVGLGLATIARICWAAGGNWRIMNRSDQPGVLVILEFPTMPGEGSR